MMNTDVKINAQFAKNTAMFLLAISPISIYYAIGDSLNLFQISGLAVFLFSLFQVRLRQVLPKSFVLYWIWCAFQMYFIVGIQGWSDILPGGVMLCLYGLSLLGFISLFDFNLLYKHLKHIFIVASTLFFIQFLYCLATGNRISFFLPIAHQTTYCGMTSFELRLLQTHSTGSIIERFSSIFAEPSYFAQYCLILLAIEMFKDGKKQLFTRFSLLIVMILLLIGSGAGYLGLLVIVSAKIIYIALTTKNINYYFYILGMLLLSIPLLAFFMSTSLGGYIGDRTAELNSTDADASVRLFYGWNQLSLWSWRDIILGGGRNIAANYVYNEWGSQMFINTIVGLIMNQGLIGVILLLWSFISSIRNNSIQSLILTIIFILTAFLENFLYGGMMTIISSFVYSAAYRSKKIQKSAKQ